MSFRETLSYNLQGAFGQTINRKLLIIESDDWGLVRAPSMENFTSLLNAGISVDKCSYNRLDSLEDDSDIEALVKACKDLRDKDGNSLKITSNFIMANPNFERIEQNKFEKYHYRNLAESYHHVHGNKRTLSAIESAVAENIMVPQLHGREHLQVNHWMNALRQGEEETLEAFKHGIFGHPSVYARRTGLNFLSAFHIATKQELEFAGKSVLEASSIFKNTFGFESKTFIAPRYIWPVDLETYIVESGIEALQGTHIQFLPVLGNSNVKLKKRFNWMGRKNVNNLDYLIRNVFFEPALDQNFAWEANALKRIETAFFWGKPAIISMHRINFMGGLSEDNRNANLKRLKYLVQSALTKWPDLTFGSSIDLV